MKKQNVRTLLLIASTFAYLLVGAAVFNALESAFEETERAELEKEELEMRTKYNISGRDFDVIRNNVIRSIPHKAGVQWKFDGALFFVTTVITTIGYGHSTPKTYAGKVFCMAYALAGIPLNLVMFQSIGERLNMFVTYLLRSLKRCMRFKHVEVSNTMLILISVNMSSLVVAFGAWAFSTFEGWSYIDSVYYCVITLTTVGFGDFVVLQSPQHRQIDYVAFSIFFIIVGLAVVSAAMNLLILRFLTMNTADERRDENLAAIRRSIVKLDAGGRLLSVNGSAISPPLTRVPVDLSQALPFSSFADEDDLETRSSPAASVIHGEDRRASMFSRLCFCCRQRRWNGVDVGRNGWPSTSSRPRRQRYRVTRPPTAVVTHLLSPVDRRRRSTAADTPTVDDDQLLPAIVHAEPLNDPSTSLWLETSNLHEPKLSQIGFVGSYRRTSSF